MEKGPNFSVFGEVSDKQKELVREGMKNALHGERHSGRFNKEDMEAIEKHEIQKTADEKKFIEMANSETNILLEKFGLEPYDFPERNYHIVSGDYYKSVEGTDNNHGAALDYPQAILISKGGIDENRLYAALVIFHETLHMKSRLVYHAKTKLDEGKRITQTAMFRNGLEVKSMPDKEKQKKEHSHFYGLNEAVVTHEEKKYLQKLMEHPMFAKENERLFSLKSIEQNKIAFDKLEISPEEIYEIDLGKNDVSAIGYKAQRKVLEYVCEEVAKDMGVTAEDVHDEFLEGQLTGKLLEIARLVEASFGKGSFRELGNLSKDYGSAPLVLETLRRCREKNKK